MRVCEIYAAANEFVAEPLRRRSVKGILSGYTIAGDRRFRRAGAAGSTNSRAGTELRLDSEAHEFSGVNVAPRVSGRIVIAPANKCSWQS